MFRCTAVFTEQAIAHYFVRGLAPATRTAVAETVQRLPGSQKTDLSSIRRIATAEGTTFRSRHRLPPPDPRPARRAGRPSRSNATSSPATALHIGEDEWQSDPVLIARGMEQGGGRPPTPESTRTTGSFSTAFAHAPHLESGMNHPVQELDISRQQGDRASESVPKLTEEETRQAASFASTDGSAYVCWLCRTYGHAMYACPFLTPEQQRFTAFRNDRYQIETRPGMRNLLQQSAREDRFWRQGFSSRSGGGARFAPRGADTVEVNSTNAKDATSVRRTRDIRVEMEGEIETVPDSHRGCRTRSCTSRTGQRMRAPCPVGNAKERRHRQPRKSHNVRALWTKASKCPNTSTKTRDRYGPGTRTHSSGGAKTR